MPDPVILQSFDPATGLAEIRFNRPAAFNALDVVMAEAFADAVAGLRALAGVRCVVLQGEGRAFMAGGDVKAFATDPDAAAAVLSRILRHMHQAIADMRAIDAPVIAGVNGTAAGAGLSLVLGADHVIAKASSRFVFAYDRLGAVPDCGGSWFLARRVGRAAALRLVLMGEPLDAPAAAAIGIVDQVVPDDAFQQRLAEVASRIARGPTRAFGLTKKLLDSELPLAAHLELEREAFMAATASEDFRAAVAAFVDKREASFTGR